MSFLPCATLGWRAPASLTRVNQPHRLARADGDRRGGLMFIKSQAL